MSILDKLHNDKVTVIRSVAFTDEYGGAFEKYVEISGFHRNGWEV